MRKLHLDLDFLIQVIHLNYKLPIPVAITCIKIVVKNTGIKTLQWLSDSVSHSTNMLLSS